MRHLLSLAALALLLVAVAPGAAAQPAPKQEFRGTWIATVINLDWPSCRTCGAAQQQAELRDLLDKLQAARINAALFQVRVESDAFYASSIEPYSHWMTGEQGRNPGYDPLAFAIVEAHARGIELHAWFNPYRVERQAGNYTTAANHVTRLHPEWVLQTGTAKFLDPGLPAVRDYVTSIVMDVVRRYDIDGVHFDDYFYPYPPAQISNQDAATFAQYGGGLSIGNWRRSNVNLFVRQVGDAIRAEKPEVDYGISPFGIWKNGVPTGITGLDAYEVIYADAVNWLDNRLLDYITPQLYWAFGGGQDYAKLAPWWLSQRNGRHLYPGLGLYRSDQATFSNTLYGANEVPRQVRFNRATAGIQGSIFFRALNITQFPSKGFADSLRTNLYRNPALTPTMAWKSLAAPARSTGLERTAPATGPTPAVGLRWQPSTGGATPVRFYAVYRLTTAEATNVPLALLDPTNLIAVTGQTIHTDRGVGVGDEVVYVVTAASANSVESEPSEPLRVVVQPTANEDGPGAAGALALSAPFPNPTAGRADLTLTLGAPTTVSATVVDALGREVATLFAAKPLGAGRHEVRWDARGAGPGTYFVVVTGDKARVVRAVNVVR